MVTFALIVARILCAIVLAGVLVITWLMLTGKDWFGNDEDKSDDD